MELSALKEIGLTDGEIKVYFALLKLGSTKTGALATSAGVSSSKVYKILARLEKKGLSSHVIREGTKYFQALQPRRILDYIDEESVKLNESRALVENMLPDLEKQMASKKAPEAAVFSGFKAVTNLYRGMLDELFPAETYYVIAASYNPELPEQKRFFAKHHARRILKKVKVKMLARSDTRGKLDQPILVNSEIRFLPPHFMGNMNILFYRDKTLMIVWSAEPVGFLLQSAEVVQNFKDYFDTLWKIAEK